MINIPDLPQDLREIIQVLIDVPNTLRNSIKDHIDFSTNHNVHGEQSMQLDLHANTLIKEKLSSLNVVHSIASEEEEELIILNQDAKYLVCFDPLDGSSLIGTNQAIGMVFAVYDQKNVFKLPLSETLLLSIYIHIGQVNKMIIGFNGSVYEYEYLMNDLNFVELESLINEAKYIAPGNLQLFASNPAYLEYVLSRIQSGLKLRYFACLISDIHFILSKKSGLFIYLNDEKHLDGKLRLMYEVAPVSQILSNLGGKSINHKQQFILDLIPNDIHQNSSLVIGSMNEVDLFSELVLNNKK